MIPEEDYLTIINSTAKPMIREELFKDKYLPLLFDSDPGLFNMRWINEVSMSPYLPVLVLDADNNLLYTVPPLRKQINSSLNLNIGHLAGMALQQASIHKEKAEILLQQHLPRIMQFADARSDEIQLQWDNLLIELGYADMIVSKEGKGISNTKKTYIIKEDMEIKDNNDW